MYQKVPEKAGKPSKNRDSGFIACSVFREYRWEPDGFVIKHWRPVRLIATHRARNRAVPGFAHYLGCMYVPLPFRHLHHYPRHVGNALALDHGFPAEGLVGGFL